MHLVIGPYWHPGPRVREARAAEHLALAAFLAASGHWPVMSQVAFGHLLEVTSGQRWDGEKWLALSRTLITAAERLHLLALPGWLESEGTKRELEMAEELGKEVWTWARKGGGFERIG